MESVLLMSTNTSLYDLACFQDHQESHGFKRCCRSEDVVSRDAHFDLVTLPFSCHQTWPDFNWISVAFVDVDPLRSNGFRVRLQPTLLNWNFFQEWESVHKLELLPPSCLHGLWTQPLSGDVVTDVIVIFSCPLSGFLFTRDPKCCPIQQTDCSQLVLQTRDDCCTSLFG